MLQLGLVLAGIIVGVIVVGYFLANFLLSGGKSISQITEKYKGTEEAKSIFSKKYAEADLSNVRTAILAFGAIAAFSSSIYALSWRDKPEAVQAFEMEAVEDDFEIEPPQTEQVKPPPPPPPPPEIQVVEDDVILEDEPEIQEIEIEEDEVIEVPEVIEEEEQVVEQEIFTIVEDMPKFKGCEGEKGADADKCTHQGIQNFIKSNFDYPKIAVENDIEGKVYVRFVVDSKGDVTDVTVAKGADKLLNDAAVALIKKMPKFTPGKQRGKAVKVQYVIPISYQLQ